MAVLKQYEGVYLWHYVPSIAAAMTFAILYFVITVLHTWKMFRTRMWFCTPFVVGGICELLGYIARAAAYNMTDSLGLYLIQAIFLLIPPVLFAATIYMLFSRIVRAVDGAKFSPISPRWNTILFVSGDWACLNIQSGGSGLLSHPGQARIGEWIIIGGLILQALMFGAFMGCALTFHLRYRAHVAATGAESNIPWHSCLIMLYLTSLAITARNVYRVVEYVMGKDSYLNQHEWPPYAFDGVLMLLVMVCFLVWYPHRVVRSPRESMVELVSHDGSALEGNTQNEKKQWYLYIPIVQVFRMHRKHINEIQQQSVQ